MGIQISDLQVNATQIFDVVFSEIYRARGGTRSHGRDGGLRPADTEAKTVRGLGALYIGQIRGYVAQTDKERIPDFLEGRGKDGNTYVFRRSSLETKGGSQVAIYRVTVNLPSPGPLRRIAAHKNVVQARVIKIPPKVEQPIVDRLIFETLWRMRDRFTPSTRAQFKDQWTALQTQIQAHGLKIPNHRAAAVGQNSDADLTTFWVPFSTEGLPANYQHMVPVQNRIRVGFNWTGKIGNRSPVIAYWWESKNTLMVNMFNVEEFMRFPAPNWGPSVVSDILKNVEEAVQHELRHAVQDLLLKRLDPKQTQINQNYHQYGEGYYSSPIEFDPQIRSLAFEFVEYWKIHLEHGRRTTDRDRLFMMKQFVGATPSRALGMRVHPFFDALKNSDVSRWRLATKKFYVEVDEALKTNEVGAATKRQFKDVPTDPLGFPIFVQMKDSKTKTHYGAPAKEFFVTPDDQKMMRQRMDHDGISRAARLVYGDYNDVGNAYFEYGIRLGYLKQASSDDFKFSSSMRTELENEYGTGDREQDQMVLDEAEGMVADAILCGRLLRQAHEWYLESGEWDAPHHSTGFFERYKPVRWS